MCRKIPVTKKATITTNIYAKGDIFISSRFFQKKKLELNLFFTKFEIQWDFRCKILKVKF